MNTTISRWFKALTQDERKRLVCFLFGIRSACESRPDYHLFLEFIRVLDNEYHDLK